MALDFFAVASYGVYPTPTPTNSRRAALAVSMGLLNIDLPTPVEDLFDRLKYGIKKFGKFKWGIKRWGK